MHVALVPEQLLEKSFLSQGLLDPHVIVGHKALLEYECAWGVTWPPYEALEVKKGGIGKTSGIAVLKQHITGLFQFEVLSP